MMHVKSQDAPVGPWGYGSWVLISLMQLFFSVHAFRERPSRASAPSLWSCMLRACMKGAKCNQSLQDCITLHMPSSSCHYWCNLDLLSRPDQLTKQVILLFLFADCLLGCVPCSVYHIADSL